MDTVQDRVQRGTAWLDANGPDRWWEKVVLEEFDMGSTCKCVLGFAYAEDESLVDEFYDNVERGHLYEMYELDGTVNLPGYWRGLFAAWDSKGRIEEFSEISSTWAVDNGFDARSDAEILGDQNRDFYDLKQEWTRIIHERRALTTV